MIEHYRPKTGDVDTDSSGPTRFCVSPDNLDKWMHQNKAEYTGVFVKGCLLDNFVLVCKRGFAAVYEHYLNEWQSTYQVEFEAGAAQEVWKRWYQFEDIKKEATFSEQN